MTHIERSDPEPMVPARLLEDVRVSMKALLAQNVNAWAEVDRLHEQLRATVAVAAIADRFNWPCRRHRPEGCDDCSACDMRRALDAYRAAGAA